MRRTAAWRNGWALAALVFAAGATGQAAQALTTTLVPTGSVWRYLDNGSNQGTAWRAPEADDTSWAAGPAQLGYGDGDEATVVSHGPNASAKYITTYFRHTFSVTSAASYTRLDLRVLRDDGVVVYLNGTEVFRDNMPTGTITYTTPASAAIDDSTFHTASVNPTLLVNGTNVLAVEIHQANGTSSDISLDLDLVARDAGATANVTRGPYLQRASATDIVVRWRTDIATDSRVRYGTDTANLLAIADAPGATTEHVVALTGLSADTTYYYSIGTTTTVLDGGDANHFFVTAPPTGSAKPTRIWVLGDSGTANTNAQAVRNAYTAFTGARHTDLWLMLGDNAYNSGTDAEYQAAVFAMYPTYLRSSVLWPTLGNHDAVSADSATQTGPYYDMFTLPTQAEAGGVVSGTEAYYSFDYGNIHFICLDSQESSRSPTGAMLTWLQSDLLATTADWVIAFWHHPPYSKGSHNSDTETQLIEMRQNALPILEQYGVDLVLAGHSHSYERSRLIDGHYGSSSTLTSTMVLDPGSGRLDGTGAYHKATLGPAAHEGAVYVVAGSSGQVSGGTLNHPVMYVSLNTLGSVVLDVNQNVLNARFVSSTGAVSDYFTVVKGGPLCGNGLKDAGEECDQSDFGGASCATQGCTGGVLTCTSTCLTDATACAGCLGPTNTATPPASTTPTPTVTPTSTSAPPSPTPTDTPTMTASSTPTATATPTWTSTATPSPTPTLAVFALGAVADAWIVQDKLDQNRGTDTSLRVKPVSGRLRRTLVRFDLATLPAGSCVQDATLRLTLTGAQNAARTYAVHAVSGTWTQGTGSTNSGVTWRRRNGVTAWATLGGDFAAPSATATTGTTNGAVRSWNVTVDVRNMAAGLATNNGWLIKDTSEGSGGEFVFASREHGTASKRPQLVVTMGPCP